MIENDLSKILLINKPLYWTSFDVVKKTRTLLKKKYSINKIKVGHCGTLDPLATGLLILCTGKKTKEIKNFENLDKIYEGVLKLGCVTDSFDAETVEKNHRPYNDITYKKIQQVVLEFIGLQKQIPPIFSAIKLDGERLYKKARRGEKNIKLKKRTIMIHKLRIIKFIPPFVHFEVNCSKGTYIRSLANDIGINLGCGAYLYSLKRTQIGTYNLQNATSISILDARL